METVNLLEACGMAQAWQLYIFESEHVDVLETPVKSIKQLDCYLG